MMRGNFYIIYFNNNTSASSLDRKLESGQNVVYDVVKSGTYVRALNLRIIEEDNTVE